MALEADRLYASQNPAAKVGWFTVGGKKNLAVCRAGLGGYAAVCPLRATRGRARRRSAGGLPPVAGGTLKQMRRNPQADGARCAAARFCGPSAAYEPSRAFGNDADDHSGEDPLFICG